MSQGAGSHATKAVAERQGRDIITSEVLRFVTFIGLGGKEAVAVDETYAPREQGQATDVFGVERVLFIQKVYGLLTISVMIAIGGGWIGRNMDVGVAGVSSLLGFLALLAAYFMRKTPGLNVLMLYGFTFLEGLGAGPILGQIAGAGHADVVLKSLLMTVASFGALTIYVFWAKTDFSFFRGFLFAGLLGLLVAGILGLFTGMGELAGVVYGYLGVLLFIGYILFDTSNVIRRFPTDEYVAATIALFLDILNLFWFILRIFMNRSDD